MLQQKKKAFNSVKAILLHTKFSIMSLPCSFIVAVFVCFTLEYVNGFDVAAFVNNKKVVCYTATYASSRPGRGAYYLKNLNPALCTHVIFGYAHLKNDTSIFVLHNWDDFMNGTENMTELKQKFPSVKFMVALGGWYDRTDKFSTIAAKGELRESLATNAIDFLKKYDFDGLDLCWLYPSKRDGNPYDRTAFVLLLKEFKRQFEPYNYTLSALLSASYDTIDSGYQVKKISDTVDFMNMNTYDFNGFWSDDIQPNAPLYSNDRWNTDYAITYMLKLGADPQKLILGIPLYGRTFIGTNETFLNRPLKLGDSFDPTEEARKTFLGPYTQDVSGVISYGEICLELLKGDKWARSWDKSTKTPFITYEDKLITYDDKESVVFKVRYAIDKKLGGVTASSLDLDDFLGDCSKGSQNLDYFLLRSIGEEMNRYLEEIHIESMDVEAVSKGFLNNKHRYCLIIYFVALLLIFH